MAASLKVFEVDEHHHVLLSQEITSTVQDGADRGGVLLNFDSHDDWGMSLATQSKVTAKEFRQLLKTGDRRVLDHVEIGTWIMPLAALGAYDCLIWVTKWANIKREAFDALVGFNENDMVRVTGRGVPAAWRALWGDTYEADWAGHHAHRVRFIILDSSNAAAFLRSSSCPRASRWTISMDLDFFTVCNSGRDSLNEIPGDRDLKSDMWRLATCVPIVRVFDLYDALHGYYTGEYNLVEATDKVEDCAQGTTWQSGPLVDRAFVENCLRRSFKRISRQWLVMLTSSAHLAEHRSSDEEVDSLMQDFQQCLQVVLKKRAVDRPNEILVARSEDYRHRGYAVRQQANAIRDRTVQLIEGLRL